MSAALRSLYFRITSYAYVISLVSAQVENQFIYNGFHEANLSLDGIAEIHPNGLLQLTNTSKQQLGHAFCQFPLNFNASSSSSAPSLSFSTNFVFAMVPELRNLGGHGIAFLISPSKDFSHAVASQYLGVFNTSNNGLSTNHVLAIELDTILSPDLKDIDENHVGIDVNSLKSIESAPATYFSNKEGKNRSLELISGDPIQVWIDYEEAENLLNITLAPIRSPRPDWPLLSRSINLSEIFLDTMYVGFSAATGTLASDHYILGWSFNKSGKAQSLEILKLPPLPVRRKPSEEPGPLVIALLVSAEWEQVVLHRDVKASNVLLDANLNGRLGDFGLARLYDHGTNPQTTQLVGTIGYLAPELTRTGKATTSTDVFAFGSFMLEVACGRRPIVLQGPPEESILVEWVVACWERGALLDASDPRLIGHYVVEENGVRFEAGLALFPL